MASLIILVACVIIIKAVLKNTREDGYRHGARDMFDHMTNKFKKGDDE